jgi:glycosyltransferase involved in cell wall biosynthesis
LAEINNVILKVLFVEDNPQYLPNPYLHTLMNAIKEIGPEGVVLNWGKELFWSDDVLGYDIVHIMWPQLMLLGHNAKDLHKQLQKCKAQGIKIVTTCHNLVPHYDQQSDNVASYEVAYSNSDAIIHFGRYSFELFEKKYKKACNVIIAHHIYDKIYKNNIEKKIAKSKLGLRNAKNIILCFGAFRNDEERLLVLQLAKKLERYNIDILAPSLYPRIGRWNPVKLIRYWKKKREIRSRYANIKMKSTAVSDEMLPFYFCAVDVVLIQRRQILNSGNLPMAYYMGKPVIGPNIGNVGTILDNTNNLSFAIDDRLEDIAKNIVELLSSNNLELIGEKNRIYALENWNSKLIAIQTLNLYRNLSNEDTCINDCKK